MDLRSGLEGLCFKAFLFLLEVQRKTPCSTKCLPLGLPVRCAKFGWFRHPDFAFFVQGGQRGSGICIIICPPPHIGPSSEPKSQAGSYWRGGGAGWGGQGRGRGQQISVGGPWPGPFAWCGTRSGGMALFELNSEGKIFGQCKTSNLACALGKKNVKTRLTAQAAVVC